MEVKQVDLSIIIVSWNVRDLLERCLSSVFSENNLHIQVIVVDNDSSDGSAQMVRERFPQAQLVANDSNVGFAMANNQAISLCRGRDILLLNPDTVVHDGALRTTVQYLDAHSDVGLVGCKILNPDGTVQRSIRRDPSFLSQLLVLLKLHALFPQWKVFQQYYATDISYNDEKDVQQIMGAYLGFSQRFTEQVGVFDQEFHLWFEEVDLCRRTREAGLRVRYLPTATITHYGGESFRQLASVRQQRLYNQSLTHYFRKHGTPWEVFLLRVVSFPSLILAAIEPLFRRFYVPKSPR